MFRATQCSSSGESIVSIHHLVCITLCRWPSGMQARPYALTLSLTSALDGVGWSSHTSAAKSPPHYPLGKTRYPLYRRLGGPQCRSGRLQEVSPPSGFDTRTVQPVASRYTDYAISTPVHYIYIYIYRVSQEERTKLRESVPYVNLYRYNPKHLFPKLNGYGDNGQRKVWTSCISA